MRHSEIIEIKAASRSSMTLFFEDDTEILPGQFLMIWAPGVGEIPISLSHTGKRKGITIKPYGKTSSFLCSLKKGDRIYFRGPYGRPFSVESGRRLIIGGGTGLASLYSLIDSESTVISSARTADELLFRNNFKCKRNIEVTDDGSAGIKGFPVDALRSINPDSHAVAYICGPEMMMYSVYNYLKDFNLELQFSLERMMKCGIGICDSCSIGGFQLCRDGPTFFKDEIPLLVEFGITRTTESGRRYSMK